MLVSASQSRFSWISFESGATRAIQSPPARAARVRPRAAAGADPADVERAPCESLWQPFPQFTAAAYVCTIRFKAEDVLRKIVRGSSYRTAANTLTVTLAIPGAWRGARRRTHRHGGESSWSTTRANMPVAAPRGDDARRLRAFGRVTTSALAAETNSNIVVACTCWQKSAYADHSTRRTPEIFWHCAHHGSHPTQCTGP